MHGADALRDWTTQPGPGVMITTETLIAQAGGDALPVRRLATHAGHNYSNGKNVVVVAVERAVPR
jgi:hypothetical protein